MNGKRNYLILSTVLLITLVSDLRAQGQAAPGMVYVSVVVKEAGDRYVTGLSKEDFSILEDGVQQAVLFLEEDAQEYEYRIGYLPKSVAKDGTWRRIRVEIVSSTLARLRLSVITTLGYYAR